MNSNHLNDQATGLATLPFASFSKTQGSPTGATFGDIQLNTKMVSKLSLAFDPSLAGYTSFLLQGLLILIGFHQSL